MLEVEIAEEFNKWDVAVMFWEKWSEFLPPVLVYSSQEEEVLLEMVWLEQEMALLKQQNNWRLHVVLPVSQTVLSLNQFPASDQWWASFLKWSGLWNVRCNRGPESQGEFWGEVSPVCEITHIQKSADGKPDEEGGGFVWGLLCGKHSLAKLDSGS